jgi:putative flippase GtrA
VNSRTLIVAAKYGLVGGVGAGVNFLIFFVLSDFLGMHHFAASSIAFVIVAFQNFLLNREWTFRAEGVPKAPLLTGYLRYVTGNLTGLGLNILVLAMVVQASGESAANVGQLLGILSGAVFNFLFAKLYVFRKR